MNESSFLIRNLDLETRQRLKVKAAELGFTMNSIVTRLIEGFLEGHIRIDLHDDDTPQQTHVQEHTL